MENEEPPSTLPPESTGILFPLNPATPYRETNAAPIPIDPLVAHLRDVELRHAEQQQKQLAQQRRKKRRRVLAVAWSTATLAVVLVVTFMVIGSSGPASTNAESTVERGARTTIAAESVAFRVGGSITALEHVTPVTGNGYANFATGFQYVTLAFKTPGTFGTSLVETEISDGTDVYVRAVIDGQNEVSQVLPKKTWYEEKIGANAAASLTSGTPNILTQLQVLTQSGNSVTPLRTKSIDGVTAPGFQVVFSPTAMANAAKRMVGSSASARRVVAAVLHTFESNPPIFSFWLDSKHRLLREDASLKVTTGGAMASIAFVMDFTHYGVPSAMTIPPTSEVASYRTYVNAVNAG